MNSSSRRTFLATAAAAPVVLRASDKSGSKRPVTGSGAYRYEVIHDWGELPAGIKYGNTHGVVEDSQGRIYVHHTVHNTSEAQDSMVVFDDKGKFVKSWGKEFKGGAHGLHIQKEGKNEFLYLCDTRRGLVVKTTPDGEEVWTIKYPSQAKEYEPGPDGKNRKYSPTNLAVAPNGDVYVGDGYGSNYINQYNNKGEYIRTFGGTGSGPGQLACPHGIIVDTRGKQPVLTVADRTNKRLQHFSLDGKHIGFTTAEKITAPCHFHTRKGKTVIPDLDARVLVVDEKNNVAAVLGDAGDAKEARKLRTQPRESFVEGQFVCPHGACFDHQGNIFVVEWVEVGRVTKLRRVA
ncbi:MAG TPA: 6-bladed beta-propeller [Bryobacteraceae bacterium]|nr:6-bladed beta-propeller [Bryobacteraceae bacterium]